jgi:hypothetical protein
MSLAFRSGPRLEHLVRGQSGLAGEVGKLRRDVADAFDTVQAGGINLARFDAPSAAVVDADGIKTTFASVAAPVTLTETDFDGALAPSSGPALINSPKRVTLTVGGGGTPAHWLGGDVVVTGTDSDGAALSETVSSAAGAGTTTTVGYFATVTEVELPAASNTGAQLTLGVAADTAAIASFSSASSAQVFDAADVPSVWNRARIGNRALAYPRRISFIFSNHADWDATTITVRGRDAMGEVVTSSVAIPNGGNATVTTDKFFASIERISVPAQSGSGGTCSVGPEGTALGLAIDPISAVEAVAVVREASQANSAAAWAVPAAGAIDDSSVSNAGPYGRYTPDASIPFDGVRSYILAYLPK